MTSPTDKVYLTTLVVIFLFHVSHCHKGHKKMHSGGGGGQYSSCQGSYNYQPSCQPHYYYEPQHSCQTQPSFFPGCSQGGSSYPCQSMGCKQKKSCWSSPQSMCFENKQIIGQGCGRPSCCYQQVTCPTPCPTCDNDGCGACSMGCNSGCGSGCNSGCNSCCSSGCNSCYTTGCNSGCNSCYNSGCNSGCSSGCCSGCNPCCNTGCNSGCSSGCNTCCNSGCNSGCNFQPARSECSISSVCNGGGCSIPNEYVLIPMLVPKQSLGPNFLGSCGVDAGCGKCVSTCF